MPRSGRILTSTLTSAALAFVALLVGATPALADNISCNGGSKLAHPGQARAINLFCFDSTTNEALAPTIVTPPAAGTLVKSTAAGHRPGD